MCVKLPPPQNRKIWHNLQIYTSKSDLFSHFFWAPLYSILRSKNKIMKDGGGGWWGF